MRRMCLTGRAELNDAAETIFPQPDKERATGKRASFPSPEGSTNKPSHFLPLAQERKEQDGVGRGGGGGQGEEKEKGSKVRRRENSNSM